MQLFDGHVATIKVVIIQIKLNRFLVKKFSKTISSHLKKKYQEGFSVHHKKLQYT